MRPYVKRRGAYVHALEALESRRVLSGVTVLPHQISLPSIIHGQGVATVIVLGSPSVDVSTIDPSSLTLTATESGGSGGPGQTLKLKGTPRVADTNGDGSPDLVLHFTRSQLKGLTGQVTIDVQGSTASSSSSTGSGSSTGTGTGTGSTTDFGSDTITIFSPGHQGRGPKHRGSGTHGPSGQHSHGHGHGSGSGQPSTVGHNGSHGHGHGH